MAKVQFTDFRASVKSALGKQEHDVQLVATSSGTAWDRFGKVAYFQPHGLLGPQDATFRRHPGFTHSRENAMGHASPG
jgi:hypothetical protein